MTALDDLQGAALAYAVSQGYTAPAPMPPPPPNPPLFDGRAARMTQLWSTSTTDQGQSPKVWDGLTFNHNAISLVSDARWLQVYRVHTEPGYFNPWVTLPPYKAAAELTKARPIAAGEVDWYADSIRLVSPFTATDDFGELLQLAYPSLSSPPLALSVTQAGIGLERSTGACTLTASGWWKPASYETPTQNHFLDPQSVLGKWVDFVIGVKWAFDATGFIHVQYRVQGGAWAIGYDRRGIVTGQWHTGSPPPTSGLDKMGFYQGWAVSSEGNVPTNTHYRRGLMRHVSQADAVASLG